MDNEIKFDLNKLNFEKNRLLKRKRLLLFSLPAVIPVALLTVALFAFILSATVSDQAYDNEDYSRADSRIKPAIFFSFFDKTLVNYNYGNIKYHMGDFSQSEKSYTLALETTDDSRECSIRINLVLTLEAQSDKLVSNKDFDKAIAIYDRAKSVLTDGATNCGISLVELEKVEQESDKSGDATDGGDEESGNASDETAQSNGKIVKEQYSRVSSKLKDAKKSKTNEQISKSQDENAEKDSEKAAEPSDESIEKLKAKSFEAQKNRSESSRKRDYSKLSDEDNDYRLKVW